jgi:hypothetical protein
MIADGIENEVALLSAFPDLFTGVLSDKLCLADLTGSTAVLS